jgi:hypothetical protein
MWALWIAQNRWASPEYLEYEKLSFDAALMTLIRPSKFSVEKLAPYWLDTPSLTLLRGIKISV